MIVSCLASGGGPGGSVDLLTSLTAADASVTNKAVTPAAVIGSFINTSMMGFNVGTITPFLNALGFGFYTKNNAYCLDEFKADMSMIDSRLRVKTNGGYFAYPYAQPSCSTYSTNISGLMNNSSHGKYGKAISKYHDAVMNSSEYIEEYLVTDAVSSASFQAQVTALNVVSNPNMIVWKDTCVTFGVSDTVDTVSNTVSAVSGTVDEVSNTVDTVSSTVSSVSSSVSALQSAFDVVSSDHYEVSSALDVAISSASALQEAFDTINIPTSAHIYGGNDTGHWTAGQIQGMIQAGSAGIAISEGANVTIDPITDPDTSITTYYISASPTTYSLCNGSSISGIVVASNNVISTYGNTAETSYVVPTMRAVYNMSSALNSAIGTKQAAGNYASATHSHTIANISDLQTALDGKQAAGDYALSDHSHTIANISGLQDALNGKAATGHNHNGLMLLVIKFLQQVLHL